MITNGSILPIETITEGWRSLVYFTDRYAACRRFAQYLNEPQPPATILFFSGPGGNGKSLLLRYLRDHYCKRVDRRAWEELRGLTDEEFRSRFADLPPWGRVAHALLDFGLTYGGDDQPQTPFYGLLALRRDLARQCLRFPLFDLACVWYLHRTNQLTENRLNSLFPAEEAEFLQELVDAFISTSWLAPARAVLAIFAKHLRESYTLYEHQRGLRSEDIEVIKRLDYTTSEFLNALPVLFAQDLNAAMRLSQAPERLVLFFDTHESFWGNQRNLTGDLYFQKDEWLRRLIQSLDLTGGTVPVLAGRDRPRWSEAPKAKIAPSAIENIQVGHLSDADACVYLRRVFEGGARSRFRPESLYPVLLSYARVNEDEVHPLYLGLCADVVLAATEQSIPLTVDDFARSDAVADKGQALTSRLLGYVDGETAVAVHAVSACRAFDQDLFQLLSESCHFPGTLFAFRSLTRFSFVWPSRDGVQNRYRIHDLLRRLLRQKGEFSDVVEEAHRTLERHFRALLAQGEQSAAAEAIYHANCLEPDRGAEEWLSSFDAALQSSDNDACRALLEVRSELTIRTPLLRGRIYRLEGDYFEALSSYDEAKQAYEEAVAAFDEAVAGDPVVPRSEQARALVHIGYVHFLCAEYDDAERRYRAAIRACKDALRSASYDANVQCHLGRALERLGDLQAARTQYAAAADSYRDAIRAADEALATSPELALAHNYRGDAFESLGAMQTELGRYAAAVESYRNAIASFDQALRCGPDDVSVYKNKGNALARLGNALYQQTRYRDATQACEEAIAVYDAALRLAPNFVIGHNNKGNALYFLGDIQADTQNPAEAVTSYRSAIDAYRTALHWAPGYVFAQNNLAIAYSSLGRVQAGQLQPDQAIQSFDQAIRATCAAQALAPADAKIYSTKGNAFNLLGEVQHGLHRHQEALESHTAAIQALDASLAAAPDDVSAHIGKAIALRGLGDAHTALSSYELADRNYHYALDEVDHALRLAPDMPHPRVARAEILIALAERLVHDDSRDQAILHLVDALGELRHTQGVAPENAEVGKLITSTQARLNALRPG